MNSVHPIILRLVHGVSLIKAVLIVAGVIMMMRVAVAALPAPLPAATAFAFSARSMGPSQLVVEWRIAPGYYLYQKRMHLVASPRPTQVIWPPAQQKHDKRYGHDAVYTGHLKALMQWQTTVQRVALQVDYQGCSQAGFCYPVMHQTITIQMQQTPQAGWLTLLTHQEQVQAALQVEHKGMLLLLFLGLGFLLALTPCVWPMIPILAAIITGQKQTTDMKRVFLLSLTYVLGIASTYALAGIAVAFVGYSIQVWLQQPIVIAAMSGLLFLLALSLFGLFEWPLPSRWQRHLIRLSSQQRRGHYLGVFTMGVLSTLILSPCVTAPLAGVLIYIGQTGQVLWGAMVLFILGMGMGIPLLLVGLSARRWLPRGGPWLEVVKKGMGFFLCGLAIWVLGRILSLFIIKVLWCVWLLGGVLFLGIYGFRLVGLHRWSRLFGVGAGLCGVLVLFHVVDHEWLMLNQPVLLVRSFETVGDFTMLHQRLQQAKAHRQPVILDFYADWCESCVAMEQDIFAQSNVQQALKGVKLLRIDLTTTDTAKEALMRHFAVIAPPTILFFTAEGDQLKSQRIVGEISTNEFLTRMQLLNHQNEK
jgi:thioredoxin:protein disulfide reductase